MNENIMNLAMIIREKHGGSVYLVGGSVRDELLGRTSQDRDLEVFGVSFEDLKSILYSLFSVKQVKLVGENFQVLQLYLNKGEVADISLPRKDKKISSGHRGFISEADPTLSVEEAANRRDFTINAIYKDILTGKYIDPFNGRRDLESRILREVDSEAFSEDPLRVWRAVQFCARFDLSIEELTFQHCIEISKTSEFKELSMDRVREEVNKMLLSENIEVGFNVLASLGLLQVFLPEVYALRGVKQSPTWHPEGDAYIHTLLCLDSISVIFDRSDFSKVEKLQILWATLSHDLGKPVATKVTKGKITSYGHEKAGVPYTHSLGKRFLLPRKSILAMKKVCEHHMRPAILSSGLDAKKLNWKQYVGAVRKVLRDIYPLDPGIFLACCEADFRGKGVQDRLERRFDIGENFRKAMREIEIISGKPRNLLSGNEIRAILQSSKTDINFSDGKLIGFYLNKIENLRDAGEISTKAEAEDFLKNVLKINSYEKSDCQN